MSPMPEPLQYLQDVVNVAPAERYTVEYVADAAATGGPASVRLTGTHLLGGGLVATALSPLALLAFLVLRGTGDDERGAGASTTRPGGRTPA